MTQTVFDKLLVEFIILTDQPFTIVEETAFRKLFSTLPVQIIGADAAKNKANKMYGEKLQQMKDRLKKVEGKFSIILDIWTSVNQYAFHGIIVQWIDKDWELQELILTLDILEGSHTGVKLAQTLANILDEFGILHRIAAMTTDNASNYDTCFEELNFVLAGKVQHS